MTRDRNEPHGGEELGFLEEEIRKLPRDIEPPRDLWPGIEKEIRAEPAKVVEGGFGRWRRELLAVAAMLALFAVAAGAGLIRFGAGPDVAVTTNPAPVPDAARPSPDLAALDLEFTAASATVLERLADGSVDPETAKIIRENLEIIEGAVREIRHALQSDPENAVLNRMLAAEYHRRSDLVRQAAALTDAI